MVSKEEKYDRLVQALEWLLPLIEREPLIGPAWYARREAQQALRMAKDQESGSTAARH